MFAWLLPWGFTDDFRVFVDALGSYNRVLQIGGGFNYIAGGVNKQKTVHEKEASDASVQLASINDDEATCDRDEDAREKLYSETGPPEMGIPAQS